METLMQEARTAARMPPIPNLSMPAVPKQCVSARFGILEYTDWIDESMAWKQTCTLKGRWLVRDTNDPNAGYSVSLWETAEAMLKYEAGEFFRTKVKLALQPYFVDGFTTSRCEVRVIEEFRN